MQVNMHGIDRVEVIDFPKSETPFTTLRLTDGKGSTIDVFIREEDEAREVATGILDVLRCLKAREIGVRAS